MNKRSFLKSGLAMGLSTIGASTWSADKWGAEQGVPVHEREGIGHQVSAELGYATPGAFAVHFDGHVSQLGAFGTLAMGARKGVLEAFVSDDLAIKRPGTGLPPEFFERLVGRRTTRPLAADALLTLEDVQ